ncbi:MAG: tetratricopeptide repeat protein [Bacteroidota bacterium]
MLLTLLWISSCGVKRKNVVSKTFHRTTTIFNYLYNAEIIWREGVKQINGAYRVPPEGYIPVWWAGTENDANSFASNFESAIEKCEIALQKHNQPENKYFDDLRFLIGRSWFYKRNYILALKNFEYVLKTFPDTKLKPDVYLWMVKTYFMDGNNVMAVKLLQEEIPGAKLNKRQQGQLALIQAQVYLEEEDYDEVLRTINKNKANIKGANNRARAHYLLGQIYADKGNFAQAYENFKKVTKLNTDYELIFNARLNIAKLFIEEQEGTDQTKKLRRLLKKMLRDEKNVDYKDRVFYEIAMLDIKINDLNGAIENLRNSISANTNNQRQKALSYYKIGQIYFYDLQDFTNAQAYFDSASTSINKDAPEYREISTISATLKEYITYTNTIQLQDSLLALSRLSDAKLEEYVDDYLVEQKRREEEAQARELEELNSLNDPNLFQQFGENRNSRKQDFYFDAPDMVTNGKVEFQQIWGSRRNEDNWRRKNKQIQLASNDQVEEVVEVSDEDIEKYGSKEKAQMIKNVPRTPEARLDANKMVEEALYGLGQVYQNKLSIPDSAIAVYNRLISRYPDSEYALKGRYALFKLYNEEDNPSKADQYKIEICGRYPNSRYCKLCKGEAVEVETDAEYEDFLSAYNALYATFKTEDYATCIDFSGFITSRFPTAKDLPRAYMIRGKSYAYLGKKDSLISVYKYIKQNYPESELIPEVNRTLAFATGVPEGGPSNPGLTNTSAQEKPDSENDPRYAGFTTERKPHEKVYIVMLVDRTKVKANILQQKLGQFHKDNYSERRLNASIFLYQNKYHMPYISQFNDEREAMNYIKMAMKEPGIGDLLGGVNEKMVFISPSNFRTAYGKKRFEDYFVYYENVVLKALEGK